jgi:hypothetical protein
MRCQNGYKQDPPKSGKCVKKTTTKKKEQKTQTKQKRCPKGTRKNKEGECVTIVKMQKIKNDKSKKEIAKSKSKEMSSPYFHRATE